MKQITLFGLLVILVLKSINSFSQTNTFPSSGNAGVGTLIPNGKLHIVGVGSQDLLLQNAGIGFSPENSGDADLVIARWENYFLDLTNWGTGEAAVATALRISAHHTAGKEATLALVRGSGGNLEFLDFYNMGYTNASQYGIRIQKRGTGGYRDFVFDQFDGTNYTPLLILTKTGFTGVGTKTPSQKLDVAGNIRTSGSLYIQKNLTDYITRRNWGFATEVTNRGDFQLLESTSNTGIPGSARVTVLSGGFVGINTQTPIERLDIDGSIRVRSGSSIYFEDHNELIEQKAGYLNIQTLNGNHIVLQPSANVLIGKTSQINSTYKLDVSGKIRADEIVVNATGADFVFAPEYKLATLSEVESFIKENNHLPGIASADEMKEDGISVSEMQTKLLQKIEELTLYLLEQNKKMKDQHENIKDLKREINELKCKCSKDKGQ